MISRVSIMVYIYLITNTINGKKYVGQTRSKPSRRWTAHKRQSREDSRYGHYPLYRSMRKYGVDNFSFEIIDTARDLDSLSKLEAYYIGKLDTLCPTGYNQELISDGIRHLLPHSLAIRRKHAQANKSGKTSIYKGVYVSKHKVYCQIEHRRVKYFKYFDTEEDAAEAYDKMALLLFGPDAKLNFEDSRLFTHEELEAMRIYFTTSTKTSSFRGVSLGGKKGHRWMATLVVKGGSIRSLGSFLEENNAAFMYDLARMWLNGDESKLNLPECLPIYRRLILQGLPETPASLRRLFSDDQIATFRAQITS